MAHLHEAIDEEINYCKIGLHLRRLGTTATPMGRILHDGILWTEETKVGKKEDFVGMSGPQSLWV